jgi:F0F1-type ATP synthase alpha subunit
VQQALMLLVLQEGALDDVPVSDVHAFVTQFASYVESVYDHLYQAIEISQDLSTETHAELLGVIKEFKTLFIAPEI